MLPEPENKAFGKVAKQVRDIFHPEGKDERYFHSTLLFIGWIDESRLPFIQECLADIAKEQGPITIDINSIGYFYNQKKQCIKVLYAVPNKIPTELNELCQRLYEKIGKPLQGKTRPAISPATIHFTITNRLKNRLTKEEFTALAEAVNPFSIPVTINEIGLYHCKDPDHRYYREICKFSLQDNNDGK
jgi:2'-5' RNA ligase